LTQTDEENEIGDDEHGEANELKIKLRENKKFFKQFSFRGKKLKNFSL
jgi:hypothetical protein